MHLLASMAMKRKTHARKFSSETGDALCVYEGVIEMINANNTKVVANVKVNIINRSVRSTPQVHTNSNLEVESQRTNEERQ